MFVKDAFVKITRYEGITALWSGLPPTLWVVFSIYLALLSNILCTLAVSQSFVDCLGAKM